MKTPKLTIFEIPKTTISDFEMPKTNLDHLDLIGKAISKLAKERNDGTIDHKNFELKISDLRHQFNNVGNENPWD